MQAQLPDGTCQGVGAGHLGLGTSAQLIMVSVLNCIERVAPPMRSTSKISGMAVCAASRAQAASDTEHSRPLTSRTGRKPGRRKILDVTIFMPRFQIDSSPQSICRVRRLRRHASHISTEGVGHLLTRCITREQWRHETHILSCEMGFGIARFCLVRGLCRICADFGLAGSRIAADDADDTRCCRTIR